MESTKAKSKKSQVDDSAKLDEQISKVKSSPFRLKK